MNPVQIIEQSTNKMAVIDLESKLLQNNIIFITEPFTRESVATYQAELIYLINKIPKNEKQSKPVSIYINSPGGELYSCIGLYDTMQYYINKGYIIETKNIGLAASAGAFILMSGSKGHRSAMPHSTTLIHQPSSGTEGTVTDMAIDYKEAERVKQMIIDITKKHTDADPALLERDTWLSAEDAKRLNIIDNIL